MQTLEEEEILGPISETSLLLKKGQGTTCGEDVVPQETVHNDPAVCNKLKGSALRGSTFLMTVYHEQKRKRLAASIRSSSSSRGSFTGRRPSVRSNFLAHIQTSFFDDASSLAEGTIPQSIVLAFVIGTLCGVFAFVYYTLLEIILDFCWQRVPAMYIVGKWSEEWYWTWIPIMVFSNCILVGLAVVYLGEPGDLAFTISMVHHNAYIPINHVCPMAVASLFSIIAGGSLGPEAPLVAICGSLGGYVSRRWFGQRTVNVVRKHTLMGMAGALAAFFGVPLGGSLFALEVTSRFGIEYFEHTVEAIFCGEVCLVVFRTLSGLPIAPIWDLGDVLTEAKPLDVVIGGGIGLIGAAVAYLFATFHWRVMAIMGKCNLLDNKNAVYRGLVGATGITILALLVPHTAFWGESEFLPIATMAPASALPRIWPTTGLIGFEMDTWWKALIIGFTKIIAISFTVAGGLRGGFIFPFFAAGAAFGRVVEFVFPHLPLQIPTLCMAAGLNVAITRTSLATPLILSFLAGEPCALPAVLAASLCSLFATSYMTFLKTQIARCDIDHSRFHRKLLTKIVDDNGDPHEIEDDEE